MYGMVGILFWELVQRKIDENMHLKIILSLLETKFKITKTKVLYKAKLFKQIYAKTIWAKLDAFGLMLVKKKKKQAFAFPDAEFPSWQNETHETHKTVCVCVCVCAHMCICVFGFHNTQKVILASTLRNNILLVSACMTLHLSFYYYFLTRGYKIMDLLL